MCCCSGLHPPLPHDQRVFINFRPVEAQAVYRGIKEGYATLAEPGRYNPVVLFIDMPPEELDVNVHPAKTEIKFSHEKLVFDLVYQAVLAALQSEDRLGNAPAQEPEAKSEENANI